MTFSAMLITQKEVTIGRSFVATVRASECMVLSIYMFVIVVPKTPIHKMIGAAAIIHDLPYTIQQR